VIETIAIPRRLVVVVVVVVDALFPGTGDILPANGEITRHGRGDFGLGMPLIPHLNAEPRRGSLFVVIARLSCARRDGRRSIFGMPRHVCSSVPFCAARDKVKPVSSAALISNPATNLPALFSSPPRARARARATAGLLRDCASVKRGYVIAKIERCRTNAVNGFADVYVCTRLR